MFDLSLTTAQEQLMSDIRSDEPELRSLAAEAEGERRPSKAVIDKIATGHYPYRWAGEKFAANAVTLELLVTQLGHADPGVALAVASSWQALMILDVAGSAAQQELFGVEQPAGAPRRLSTALLYEGFGRGPSELATTARRSGPGWELGGRKELVVHPTEAKLQVLLARDADTGRLEAFVVRPSVAGYHVERDDAAEGKLGLRAAHTAAVTLSGVFIPESDRLSSAGGNDLALHRAVAAGRLLVAGVAIGVARASVDYSVGWAVERKAFGRTIASYQGVSFVLADLATAIDMAELLVWDTVSGLDQQADVAEIERATARALARTCAVAADAGRQATNLLGVHGIITDHPVERWYRGAGALSTIDMDPLAAALDVQ